METISREARILLVDDDTGNLKALERILRRRGQWQLESVTDSRRALAVYASFGPDLLVTDLHMPYLDGFQVMEHVRSARPADDYFPIVVISADLSRDVRRRALAQGAKDFLNKPFDDDEVVLRIHNLLETRFLHEVLREQNRQLDERVRDRTTRLEQAHLEILERLARAAELRDDDTGEHTRRVGETAAVLAGLLGLPPEEVEVIRRAARLHDVGKIGTPDSVLLKPGRLSAEEQELMRAHTAIGARLLTGSPSPLLQRAEEIALYHHERWDGAGYSGLAGEAIPLSARIVAVADVFDALTHSRPYKRAWLREEALAEIRSQSGRHFDPQIVDVFLSHEGFPPAVGGALAVAALSHEAA